MNSLGSSFSVTLGGILGGFYGYRQTCDIMAILALIFTLIYFIVNVRPKDCIKDKKKRKRIFTQDNSSINELFIMKNESSN